MWTKSDNSSSLRFSKRDRTDLLRDGWNEFNADDFGTYRIQDVRNDVNLVFSIIRQDNDIAIRIEGDSVSIGENTNSLSLLIYMVPKRDQSTFLFNCPYSSYSGIVYIFNLCLLACECRLHHAEYFEYA